MEKAGYEAHPDALSLVKKTNGQSGVVDVPRDAAITLDLRGDQHGPRRITDVVVTDDKEPKVTCPESGGA